MTIRIRRREFIAAFGSVAVAWPFSARAQQAMPAIGVLNSTSPANRAHLLTAFQRGVREIGYIEGRNVAIEYRWAQDQYDRLPDLAADLVRRVAVIAAHDTPSALAAKAATTTIPIIFASGGDPIQLGLVASLNRPDGNVTGVTFLVGTLAAKQLELLHELLPGGMRFAVLVDPKFSITGSFVADVQAAALAISKQIEILYASNGDDIETAFRNLVLKRADGLLVGPGPLLNNRRAQLVTLAAYHRVPAIYSQRETVEAGGLMSYGLSLIDAYRQAGIYTARILKGEKTSDLPVMQSTKFELVINLNTAKTFGLAVPPGVLAIADEVVE